MATVKNVGSQLTNLLTYELHKNENLSLAKNVFRFKNLPSSIDFGYISSKLIRDGAVAFFVDKDEELKDTLYALPFTVLKYKKPYDLPYEIIVQGEGRYTKKLKNGEFVIMYDNTEKRPIFMDILQYSERLAICDRTSDINIKQQRTARVWIVPNGKEKTFKDMISSLDSFEENISTYEGLNVESINCLFNPAPFITDKVDEHKQKIYNEFLSFIGISSITYNKKERMITSEIEAQIGGAVAKRFSRFEPRFEAINQINILFKDYLEKPIELEYYDGVPKSEEKEDEKNDISDISNVSNNDGV